MRSRYLYVVSALGGAVLGMVATVLSTGPSNFARVAVINESGQELTRVEVTEDRFGNRYVATNVRPNGAVEFPVFAWGELGYRVEVRVADHFEYTGDYYAEAGYQVTHVVSPSGLSVDVSLY